MNEKEYKYLINLTNAYDTNDYGVAGVRRMYSFNIHGLLSRTWGGEEYYSQEYQDFVVDNLIFHHMRGGFFIDVGANDPIYINNTFFFEKERGWNGLAFEPIYRRREKWKCRKTECLGVALGNRSGVEEFVEYRSHNDYMSGFLHSVDYKGEIEKKYMVEVRRLAEIFEERKINHVDYLSLDVEGAELEVLQGIDFDKCDISCMTIETEEREKTFEIRKYMIEKGYVFGGRLWQDDIWVKKGIVSADYEKNKRQELYKEYAKG